MQYLVSTKGNIIKNEQQTYVVTAKNKQEAIKNATGLFAAEYEIYDADVSVSTPKARTLWSLLSSLLMCVTVFLSFIKWTFGHERFYIYPDLRSGLLAMLFYATYLIRFKGVKNIPNSNWVDFISCPLTVLTFSALFNTFLYKDFSIPIFNTEVGGLFLLILGIIFSLCGLKPLSILTMIFTCLSAIINFETLSKAMGFWGFVFIFCAIMGLLVKASIEPAFYELFPALLRISNKLTVSFTNDLLEAKEDVNKITSNVKNRITVSVKSVENTNDKGDDNNA